MSDNNDKTIDSAESEKSASSNVSIEPIKATVTNVTPSSNVPSSTAPAAAGWGGWGGWGNFIESTQQLAFKAQQAAQEIAEQAKQVATERAEILVKQAHELRSNVDFESAISKIGAASSLNNDKYKNLSKQPLDVIYITENVVSMAFPIDAKRPNPAVTTGNDIHNISNFLRKRHGGHYMIWNISEEAYDYSLFNDQVLEYKFPGHPAPPLGLLFKICTSIESWLDADEKNIAIAHCLTGKGRTAALLACVLTWLGEFSTPVEAIQYISDRRNISVDALTIPSQRRYLQYFSNMLDGVKPRSEPLLLRRIIMNSIPIFGDNGGGEDNNGCGPYMQLFKNGKLIATAAPVTSNDSTGATAPHTKAQLKWIPANEGNASFNMDCAIQGDILLRCRHADSRGQRISMFRAGFHTGYVPCGVLRLTKAQLDGANTDDRFDDEFFIDLIFASIDKPSAMATDGSTQSTSATANTTPNDGGIMIDATSSDRYETSLHRDSKFWESVNARKQRSKKRRSRRFVSEAQEQFSIGGEEEYTDSYDELNEIKFSVANSTATPMGGHSNLSDEELIMQLAHAEDDTILVSTSASIAAAAASEGSSGSGGNATGSGQSNNTAANIELQALEDLEKELGLDDLNLFKPSSSSTAAATSAGDVSKGSSYAPVSSAAEDEDNLDDLEKYLQSLNA